ncbi:MAG TPA: hypothetical protein VHX88_03890 [Solirubrobacteraceae bacterium]|jgi:hypothetical protein|nr:hypothetical protein [Solirubrobacteraceae bacterium]
MPRASLALAAVPLCVALAACGSSSHGKATTTTKASTKGHASGDAHPAPKVHTTTHPAVKHVAPRKPPPPPNPVVVVRATVERYGQAVASRDYKTICALLSSTLLAHMADVGLPCETAQKQALSDVIDPHLSVQSVSVHGAKASARVYTTAFAQAPSNTTLELELESSGWKIASLAAS